MKFNTKYIYSQLIDALNENSIAYFAETLYRLVDFPVMIMNSAYTILGYAPHKPIGDKYWDSAITKGETPSELIISLNNQNITSFAHAHRESVFLDFGDISYPRALSVLHVKDINLGFLSIYISRPIDNTDEILEICKYAGKLLSFYLHKESHVGYIKHSLINMFSAKIFEGNLTDQAELNNWIKNTGLEFHSKFVVLAIFNNKMNEGMLDYLYNIFSKATPYFFHSGTQDIHYYLVYNIRTKDNWKYIHSKIARFLASAKLHCGFSLLFDNILLLKNYMDQARESLSFLMRLNNHRHIIGFEQAQFYIMLMKITDNLSPANYLHPCFQILQEYDSTYHTEYEITLKLYLKNNCNSQKTTEQLGIHRNTTLYRLNKIEDLCGFSLSDPDTQKKLILSSWLSDMIAHINTPSLDWGDLT